jgi:4-amino-4-deoxy-L-arabinose transferase-like glycosyltransferase
VPPLTAPADDLSDTAQDRQARDVRWLAASGLVFLAGVLAQLRFVGMSLGGELHDHRQTQTAMVVREFMRHGFDWRTPLPVFGLNSYAPFEVPVFQWIAAEVGRILGFAADQATRLTGATFFQLTAVLVWWIAARWFSRASALAALVLFQFLPFGLQWGHAALIEFMPVACMLVAVLLLEYGDRERSKSIRVAAAAGVVVLAVSAVLTKSTTALVLAPLLFVPGLRTWRSTRGWARYRSWAIPAAALVLAALAGAWWTAAADGVKASSRYTVPLTSSHLVTWTFGTIDQRLDPSTWLRVLDGYWGAITGGAVAYVILCAIALVGWKARPAVVVVAFVPLLGPIVFTNLYWVHDYYSCAVFTALVLLAGAAVGAVARRLTTTLAAATASALAVALLLLLAWLSPRGEAYWWNLESVHASPPLSVTLDSIVPAGQGVVYLNCDWNPTVPFYADRPALMVTGWPGSTPTVKDLTGFTYAAFCSEPADGFDGSLATNLPDGISWERVGTGIYELSR